MPRRNTTPLDEMMSTQHQPRSRLPHSSMIQAGQGSGLYAGGRGIWAGGNGLYAGGHGLAHKSVTGKTLLGYGLPPALQSQPYSTHYQWGVTLPPAYQRIVRGNGLYP